jgi:hypothetical protein
MQASISPEPTQNCQSSGLQSDESANSAGAAASMPHSDSEQLQTSGMEIREAEQNRVAAEAAAKAEQEATVKVEQDCLRSAAVPEQEATVHAEQDIVEKGRLTEAAKAGGSSPLRVRNGSLSNESMRKKLEARKAKLEGGDKVVVSCSPTAAPKPSLANGMVDTLALEQAAEADQNLSPKVLRLDGADSRIAAEAEVSDSLASETLPIEPAELSQSTVPVRSDAAAASTTAEESEAASTQDVEVEETFSELPQEEAAAASAKKQEDEDHTFEYSFSSSHAIQLPQFGS